MAKKLKILFIEDSLDDVELLLVELGKGGIVPKWDRVDNADHLKATLSKTEWDLIISDYSMPGFSGLTALSIVKQMKVEAPFIIVSGAIGEETAVSAMRGGASDYIMKSKLARFLPAVNRELAEAIIRKKALEVEKELVREKERAQAYLQVAASIIIVLNKEQKLELINNKGLQLLGYKEHELIGKNWFDTCRYEPDISKVKKSFDKLMKGEISLVEKFDNEVVTKSGQRLLISWTSHIVTDDLGRPKGTLNAGVDITEKKKVQEALIKSEAKYRELVETAANLVWKCDAQGRFTFVNAAWKNVLGYNQSEMIGFDYTQFILPEVLERDLKRFKETKIDGNTSTYDTTYLTKSGEPRNLQFSTKILLNEQGDFIGASGTAIDITIQKAAENKLMKSESLYRNLITSMQDGILQVDNEDMIYFANKKFCEMIGYSSDELMGNIAHRMPWSMNQDRDLFTGKLKKRQRNQGDTYEVKLIHKSGRVVWVLISGSPLVNKNGIVAGSMGIIKDITDHKNAENNARILFESSRDAIMTLSPPDWNFTSGNEAAIEMFGAQDKLDFITRPPWAYSPKYQLNGKLSETQAKDKIEQALSRGMASFEWEHMRLNGNIFTASVLLTRVEVGESRFLQATVRDISDRKKGERLIKESEERYRVLADSALDAIIVCNAKKDIISWNQGAEKMFGFSKKEAIGKKVSLIIPKKFRDAHEKGIEKFVKAGSSSSMDKIIELEGKKKNRDVFPIELSLSRWSVGGNLYAGAFIRDITERKIGVKALAESEEKYRAIVEQSLEAIYTLDPTTMKIVETNATFHKLLGYTMKDLKQMQLYDLIAHDRDNINSFISKIMLAKSIDIGERQWRKKNGEIITVLVSAGVIQIAEKSVIVITGRDITPIKEVERKLQTRNDELDTFVYKASHDLRSPLASTQGLINISRKEVQDKTALKYLGLIDSAMSKLDDILEDLTQLTIIRQGELKYTSIRLKPFIEDILDTFQGYPQIEGLKMKIDDQTKSAIRSDSTVLNTALRNVIENAIKYRKFKALDSRIDITISKTSKIIKLTISDNGIGIEKAFQSKIFDMFYRANESSKGTGLGLFIAKNAVERLNGMIELLSAGKEGTQFNIYLPTNKTIKL